MIPSTFFLVCSIEIQIDYFEKEGGIFTKVFETVISAKDVPLSQSFLEEKALAEVNTEDNCDYAVSYSYFIDVFVPTATVVSLDRSVKLLSASLVPGHIHVP